MRELLVKFIEEYNIKDNAVCLDIWSWSGNEVVYLLWKWYQVIAIDGEKMSEEVILPRISDKEKEKFEFKQQKIENLKLPQNIDLAYTFYTLQFCNHKHFDTTIKMIQDSIIPGWFFVGNFLWIHDDWKHLIIKKKEEIENIFSDFIILSIKEKEYDRQSKSNISKHRHEIEIIAQKK